MPQGRLSKILVFLNLLTIVWQIFYSGACNLISHWHIQLWLLWQSLHFPSCLVPVQHCHSASGQPSFSYCRNSHSVIAWLDREKHVVCSGRSSAFVSTSVRQVFIIHVLFQQHFLGRQGPAFKGIQQADFVDEWASCSWNKDILKAQKWTRYLTKLYK